MSEFPIPRNCAGCLARHFRLRRLGRRQGREAVMAKMAATEWAQEMIDGALQLHGGLGVTVGQPVERLYREIRALRIYEGATEVQKLIVGKGVLARAATGDPP